MAEPTAEQTRCGRVLYGPPALCTCGTCSSIPAPWHVDPDDREDMEYNNHILASNGNTVCFMAWSGDPENNEPHEEAAKIIAAAPAMLEVCKHYADQYCEGWCKENGGFFPDCGGCAARSVVERAT